jgi:hypothetical protein
MEMIMTKVFLALGAAAVALSATPAMADRHSNNGNRHNGRACAQWRHGNCVRWDNHGYRVSSARHARWNSGYRFGPRYSYTSYRALPRTYVSRYDLSPDYRYVYQDNYIYVVNPRTYAVERIIDALTR